MAAPGPPPGTGWTAAPDSFEEDSEEGGPQPDFGPPSQQYQAHPIPSRTARPCKECRTVKARCLWDEDASGPGGEARCRRCREKDRPCTPIAQSSGLVRDGPVSAAASASTSISSQSRSKKDEGEDAHGSHRRAHEGEDAHGSHRRARWACLECKKRKRACVGSSPNFVELDTPEPTSALPEIKLESFSRCTFCTKYELTCEFPPISGTLLTVLEQEWHKARNPSLVFETVESSAFKSQNNDAKPEDAPLMPEKQKPKKPPPRQRREKKTAPSSRSASPSAPPVQDSPWQGASYGHQNVVVSAPLFADSLVAANSFSNYSFSPPSFSTPMPVQSFMMPLHNAVPLQYQTPSAYGGSPYPMGPQSPMDSTTASALFSNLQPANFASYASAFELLTMAAYPAPELVYRFGTNTGPALDAGGTPPAFLLPVHADERMIGASSQPTAPGNLVSINAAAVADSSSAIPGPVPLPLSFQPSSNALPSTECISWLVGRYWDLSGHFGRVAPVHRERFFRTCVVPGPQGGPIPLFWIILWGVSAFLGSSGANGASEVWDPVLAELTPSARKAIVDRAKMAMISGLEQITADLAVVDPGDPEAGAQLAVRAVPLLQGLALGIIFSEKAGGTRNMVSLASISVKFGAGAASALRAWIIKVRTLLYENRLALPAGTNITEDQEPLEAWMRQNEIEPHLPFQESLAATQVRPETLRGMSRETLDEIVMLAEFSACYYYCVALDAWAADLLGSSLQLQFDAHVPAPFDSRGFETSDGIPKLLPAVPGTTLRDLFLPTTTPADRAKMFSQTYSDAFRLGPHVIPLAPIEIERLSIAVRFRARDLGFPRLYPDAFNGSEEIKEEVLRTRSLMKELLDALPAVFLKLEEQGKMDRILELERTCPTWGENIVPVFTAFVWAYEFQASARSPPPDWEPDADWYSSSDGIEAGSYAVLGARFIRRLLDLGYDVNSMKIYRWLHTRIERMMRILFMHYQNARRASLPAFPLFEHALAVCLRWLQSIHGQERYQEWVGRIGRAELEMEAGGPGALTYADAEHHTRRVISAQDKALAKFKAAIENVDHAVLGLLEAELGGQTGTADL